MNIKTHETGLKSFKLKIHLNYNKSASPRLLKDSITYCTLQVSLLLLWLEFHWETGNSNENCKTSFLCFSTVFIIPSLILSRPLFELGTLQLRDVVKQFRRVSFLVVTWSTLILWKDWTLLCCRRYCHNISQLRHFIFLIINIKVGDRH